MRYEVTLGMISEFSLPFRAIKTHPFEARLSLPNNKFRYAIVIIFVCVKLRKSIKKEMSIKQDPASVIKKESFLLIALRMNLTNFSRASHNFALHN